MRRYGSTVHILFASLIIFLAIFHFCDNRLFAENTDLQYKLKAGFLYKFLLFVQWPASAPTEQNPESPMVIGIYGDNPFGEMFTLIEGKPVNGRILKVLYFTDGTALDELKKCHVLFLSASLETSDMKKLLTALKPFPILTVSEVDRFVEAGGMINFIMAENKISLEVNKDAAESVGLKMRSKLLRVAVKVIESKNE